MVLRQAIPSLNVFLLLNNIKIHATLLVLVLDVDVLVVLMKRPFGARDDLGRVFVILRVKSLSCTARAVVLVFEIEKFGASSACHVRVFLECFDLRLKLGVAVIFIDISETHDVLQHLVGVGARRLSLFV